MVEQTSRFFQIFRGDEAICSFPQETGGTNKLGDVVIICHTHPRRGRGGWGADVSLRISPTETAIMTTFEQRKDRQVRFRGEWWKVEYKTKD